MLSKKRQARVDRMHSRSVKEKPMEEPVVKPIERPPKTLKPEEVKALVGDDDAD